MSQKRVAIIGAGAAGLICARQCLREGLDIQIFEKSGHSGGLWVVDNVPKELQELNETASKVYSSIYDNLQTNLIRYIMGVSEFPFDETFPGCKDTRLFPGQEEVSLEDALNHSHWMWVLRYLDAFKKEYDLEKYIFYETEVIDVHRSEHSDIEWQIKYQSNGGIKSSSFHAVVVCSGHLTVPNLPDLKKVEGFGRPCLHSHLYRNPDRYKDKVVVVLGNKASGRDIAMDIANRAKRVYVCGRRWDKHIDFTKPFGSKSNLTRCTSISHCPAEGTVQLDDGTVLSDVDEILFCTGYAHDFPFLKNSQLISTSELFVYPLYKHVFHTKHPTLCFIGASRTPLPFMNFECQSKYFTSVITGKSKLPDYTTMMKEIEQDCQAVEEKNRDLTYFRDIENDPFDYMNELRSLSGESSKLPSWRRDAYWYYFPIQRKEPVLFRGVEVPSEIVKRAKEEFDAIRKNKENGQRK